MQPGRLDTLALLSIEADVLQKINFEDLILLFGFGLGTLSLLSVSPDAESSQASDLDPSLVMGAMTSGF